jgi:tRNA (cytidine/uridine-2'-O-)-methyltransferase
MLEETMHLALYQPDIPQNTGTLIRLGACMGVPVEIIEPCGFPFSIKALRRAGMDYLERAELRHHMDWAAFQHDPARDEGRLVLLTTKGNAPYADFAFQPGDTLLVGRESAGVPENVHAAAQARVVIPMAGGVRSLNVAVAAAMVLGEALRQTGGFSAP